MALQVTFYLETAYNSSTNSDSFGTGLSRALYSEDIPASTVPITSG
jgi:hypothetical protein